ncbi:MAG: hypothetical protein KGI90_17070 [Burkholderiales bacterium]|nr:hypothetical protein [Burkholderiales bacterium]
MSRSSTLLARLGAPLWSRRSTLGGDSGMRIEVCPPSLRCRPAGPCGTWQRLLFWLLAPAPHQTSPTADSLPRVRADFQAAIADLGSDAADRLRQRVAQAVTLRELWHLRTEVFRVVGLAHSQTEAGQRLARLNRHFPTRSPRSQFAPL